MFALSIAYDLFMYRQVPFKQIVDTASPDQVVKRPQAAVFTSFFTAFAAYQKFVARFFLPAWSLLQLACFYPLCYNEAQAILIVPICEEE